MTGAPYYVCSVSTCQGRVTNYAFCSVSCWDAHLPTERHRPDSAGAIERKAPMTPDTGWQGQSSSAAEGQRRIVRPPGAPGSPSPSSSSDDDVLVVVTKVRKYIADRSGGMNTSASLYTVLTEKIKRICDAAIEEARAQGRKTVMDRDVR